MAYADLTVQQQSDIQTYVQLVRSAALSLRQAIHQMKGVTAAASLQGNSLLGPLAGGDAIPDESGYPGAEDLTKGNVNSLRDDFIAVLATYDETTKNNIVLKAIGSVNFAANN